MTSAEGLTVNVRVVGADVAAKDLAKIGAATTGIGTAHKAAAAEATKGMKAIDSAVNTHQGVLRNVVGTSGGSSVVPVALATALGPARNPGGSSVAPIALAAALPTQLTDSQQIAFAGTAHEQRYQAQIAARHAMDAAATVAAVGSTATVGAGFGAGGGLPTDGALARSSTAVTAHQGVWSRLFGVLHTGWNEEEHSVEENNKHHKELFERIDHGFESAASRLTAYASIGALTGFLTSSVTAALTASKVENSLADAFARFPGLADTSIEKIDALGVAREKLTGISHLDTEASATELAQLRLSGAQITQLLPLIQDYSTKTGKDMVSATGDITSAMEGHGRGLLSAGIKYNTTGSAAQDYTNIVKALRVQVGGYAQNEGKTAAGQLDIAKAKFDTLKESIGTRLLPVATTFFNFLSTTAIPDITSLADWIGVHVVPSLKDMATWLGKNKDWLVPLAGIITGVVLAWKAFNAVLEITSVIADHSTFFLIAGAIVGIIAGLIALQGHWKAVWTDISHFFENIWKNSIGKVIGWIEGAWDWVTGGDASKRASANPAQVQQMNDQISAQADAGAVVGSRGLVLPGYAPGQDTVALMASPGEAVLVPELTRQIGAGNILAANAAASRGRMAFGGIVGSAQDGSGVHYAMSVEQALLGSQQSVFGAKPAAAAAGAPAAAPGAPTSAGGAAAASATTGTVIPAATSGVAEWVALMDKVITAKLGAGAVAHVEPIMAAQMAQESSGNAAAQNLTDSNAQAGHPSVGLLQFIPCVPLTSMILTRRGWLRHDQVKVGDQTIGLNPVTGRSQWTRVTAVLHPEGDAEVWRIGGSRWSADVTPGHRWAVERHTEVHPETLRVCPECGWEGRFGPGSAAPRSISTHRGRAHRVRARGDATELVVKRRMATTKELLVEHSSRDRIVLAAPADTTGIPALSVEDCAVLGWLHGDGHLRPAVNIYGEQTGWDGDIYQAKPAMVTKLRALLAHVPHSEHERQRERGTWPEHNFKLRRAYVTDLMKRSEVTDTALDLWVSRLSPDQRAGWLDAMIDAEGNNFDGYTRISQVDGPVQDAIRLAVYLDGWRPSYSKFNNEERGFQPAGHVGMANPRLAANMLHKPKVLDRQPVWCVTTEMGTWTMRQGRRITLTGNSTFSSFADPGFNTNIYDPESQMRAFMNYVPKTYGSFDYLTSIHNGPYDSGGWLPANSVGVSTLNKPEAILTPDQWTTMHSLARGNAAGGSPVNITVAAGAVSVNGAQDTRAIMAELEDKFTELLANAQRRSNVRSL